jgi:lysyl-tRNA synthetase class 2
VASRSWQIESLYRANAKYQPEWIPRFLCFAAPGDLPRTGIAALRAEAFITPPRLHYSRADSRSTSGRGRTRAP